VTHDEIEDRLRAELTELTQHLGDRTVTEENRALFVERIKKTLQGVLPPLPGPEVTVTGDPDDPTLFHVKFSLPPWWPWIEVEPGVTET
jgi:hypothetical protein